MTLAQKLHAIQSLARPVAKRGVNPEQGWEYLQIEDAVLAAKRAMKKHKLILTGTLAQRIRTIGDDTFEEFHLSRVVNEKGSGYMVDLVFKWTLEDTESEETREYHIPGSGWGYDKAVFKALTGSRKYAIIFIFNLAVGNDVEAEREVVSRSDAKERQKEIAKEKLETALQSDNPKIRAIAEEGLDALAKKPQLMFAVYPESNTVRITGDKDVMKANADLLKEFKLGGNVVVQGREKIDGLMVALSERGVEIHEFLGVKP